MIDAATARAKLAEHITKQDTERGRPLTETEKVRNLFRAIYSDEIDAARAEVLQSVLKIIDEEGFIDTKRGWKHVRERIFAIK
jgi:hypothetical protein